MGNAQIPALKSTIGRTHERLGRPAKLRHREGVARRRSSMLLDTVLNWLYDPLGVFPDLDAWSLTDEEILADLEYGRD